MSDEGRMTCQVCARAIKVRPSAQHQGADVIAHHGFQRPGYGYQTDLCMGARELPFEVSRDVLGVVVSMLEDRGADLLLSILETNAERRPVTITYHERRARQFGRFETSDQVTRATFEAWRAKHETAARMLSLHTFDDAKARQVRMLEIECERTAREKERQQARYDGWKEPKG